LNSLRFLPIFLLFPVFLWAQHTIEIKAKVNISSKVIQVNQEITFNNTSNDTIKYLILNDWNNAFSSKSSALAKRFSDEFKRSFHLASENDKGYTKIISIIDDKSNFLQFERLNNQIDVIKLLLKNPILPNQSQKITTYFNVKIPNDKFTEYGFNSDDVIYLKDWFLSIPRYENKQFLTQSNENLDDISNELTNFSIRLEIPENYIIFSDLNHATNNETLINLSGNKRQDFTIILQPKEITSYKHYKNEIIEVISDMSDKRLNDIQTALVIDKLSKYVAQKLGNPTIPKIVVSQKNYDKNPFYGVNQLPSFINPFPDEFIFEIKFLKTFLNNYLKENIQINHRKDHWITEGIQQFLIMQYIDENYPNFKMLGSLAKLKILKGYNIINMDFNDQFYYAYLLMARKNLDQPIGDYKSSLIKFNEQIAGKYRAGLSLRYLDSYLENEIVLKSISEYMNLNQQFQTNRYDFEYILTTNSNQNLDWFFRTIIEKRDLIDYTFSKVKKKKESIQFTLKNKTQVAVPIAVYGLKDKEIVYKKWFTNIAKDSTITIPRNGIEKLVINYKNEVPEFNARNNWYNLKSFLHNNRPIKFTFFKDIENPFYNQIFYVPSIEYNLYNGISFGLRINNRSILNKPFIFDLNPEFSTNTGKILGSTNVQINQFIRDGRLFNIRYSLGASMSNYAPDALFTRINPNILFSFRDENFRQNKKEYIQLSQLHINREKTAFAIDNNTENYSVFNAKYFNIQSEMTKHYSLNTDLQLSSAFGKISGEIEYRKLFEDNRRINLRFYFGTFMYKSTNSDFFSFGIDRPTDYLFNYNFIGRSESSGIFSQQFVLAEGGFKSKFNTRYANQWITAINGSFNIWNWIEVYGDIGLFKNKLSNPKFIYDSGIHLNLVPDYFELFFPVYSSNGFELKQDNYNQKIRFVVTLSPKTLISLFTRKWF
jgi:hypothetical protein